MHQTTSGETLRVRIFDKKSIKSAIEKEEIKFENIALEKNCIYKNLKTSNSKAINFLNLFDECEKIYPFLGDAFLSLFFGQKILKSKKKRLFYKKTYLSFLSTIKEENAKNILEWVIGNSSTDRQIDVKESYVDDIQIEVSDDCFFKLEYDCSFLGNKKEIELKDYRFIIIDGFIESIGEIHHMLHYAAKSKEPHVIFCFGMSDEVKHVIIENNKRKITQIMPISMQLTEDTVNILNDIALLHRSDVVSSAKGQTISQAITKDLEIGSFINISREGFAISPVASKGEITSHIKYLQKRIYEARPETNVEPIKNRIKNISAKSMTIFINKDLTKNTFFTRSLDYGLRMLKNTHRPFYSIKIDEKDVMMPVRIYEFLVKKVNTTKKLVYNLEKAIIISEKE
jgi:hypothetical protein